MSEPRTKTGVSLLAHGRAMYRTQWAEVDMTNLVRAIEQEAAAAERERLRATMAKWDGDDWFCQDRNERIAMLLDHFQHPLAEPNP